MSTALVFRCLRCGTMNRMLLVVSERQAVCGRCKAELDTTGPVGHVDLAELDRTVAASPVPVLVDFWAPWCAPCRVFAPVLDRLAQEQAGRLVVLKLDTEAHPGAGTRLGIQAIPTLVAFRQGREVERVSGALPLEALRRFAATALGPGV